MNLDANTLKADILEDMRVELSEEFDLNFKRKAFFSQHWKPRSPGYRNTGSLLSVRGHLRESTQGFVYGDGVRFTSPFAHAAIHNEGGQITVTPKMKAFFWAKYKKTKDEFWKRMALMKVGKTINIPERRFIGDGPDTQRLIRTVIDDNANKLNLSVIDFFSKNSHI